MNTQLIRCGSALLLAFALCACDGAGDQLTATAGGSGSGSQSSGGGGTSSATNTPAPSLGVLNGTTFTARALSIGTSPLSAGGSSSVRVDIVDTANNNSLITDSTEVTFSSPCISQGTARMPSVTTATGSAAGTYTDLGCGTSDTITATATVGSTLQASGTITVNPDTLGSISFVSASPPNIGLRSTGNEISRVTFKVESGSGGPVRNQPVSFSLDTTAGGIAFSDGTTTATKPTDANGQVVVIVKSGTVTTVVRVKATVTVGSTTISSQSEKLTIETSIADQDSFTIAAEKLNPLSLGCVGATNKITVRMADRYNNPVKDGTAVSFTTEGGAIEPSCTTAKGACTVTWTSQNPIPENYCGATTTAQIDSGYNADCGADSATTFDNGPRPGRTTILATAVGEENFTDSNGNGFYDDGEAFDDLDEAFLDMNRDGSFNLLDTFVDFDGDTVRDAGSGKFTGLLCKGPTLCDSTTTATSLHVRSSLVLSMSAALPDFNDEFHVLNTNGLTYTAASNTFTVAADAVGTANFLLRDLNRQPLPAGSTITATIAGTGATLVAGAAQTDKGTNNDSVAANLYPIAIKGGSADTAPSSVVLTLKITSPACGTGGTQTGEYQFIVNTP